MTVATRWKIKQKRLKNPKKLQKILKNTKKYFVHIFE